MSTSSKVDISKYPSWVSWVSRPSFDPFHHKPLMMKFVSVLGVHIHSNLSLKEILWSHILFLIENGKLPSGFPKRAHKYVMIHMFFTVSIPDPSKPVRSVCFVFLEGLLQALKMNGLKKQQIFRHVVPPTLATQAACCSTLPAAGIWSTWTAVKNPGTWTLLVWPYTFVVVSR